MVVRVNGFIKKGMKIMEKEKEYEIRNLTSEDVFPMSQIISKIGVDELASCFKDKDIQKIMEEAKDKEVVDIPQAVGVQVVMKLAQVVLKNLPSSGICIVMDSIASESLNAAPFTSFNPVPMVTVLSFLQPCSAPTSIVLTESGMMMFSRY